MQAFDTMSAISDGTTGTSVTGGSCYGDSREVLHELSLKMGAEYFEERFRVDRRKLEILLSGGVESYQSADNFFKSVQEESDTTVIWPSRLKIGAKSKKDPHIIIAGVRSAVKAAKEMVISILDARSNRVTMKLDVSYTDHSHIIGRKGDTIQRVMKDTSCHIHFPDSNRNNTTEKSNQVSIAGEMEGVEAARERVRNLTPLIFSFELPLVAPLHPVPDSNSPELQKIQVQYDVQISFRTRPKLHATLVVVKGSELELEKVKEATLVTINYMCESQASQVLVQTTIEISPQHHLVTLGENRQNLKMIIQITRCQIMVPDADDPNIPVIKKSNINIMGAIDDVYRARQMLLGALPLVVMFDLPEDISIDNETILYLMRSLGVTINIRNKPKQSTLSVVIRGVEKHASKIYEARHRLLSLPGEPVVATVPESYHIPPMTPQTEANFNQFLMVHANYGFNLSPMPVSPMSPLPMWAGCVPQPQYKHLFPPQLVAHQYPAGYISMPPSCNSSMSSGFGSRTSPNMFANGSMATDSIGFRDYRDYSVYSPVSSNSPSMQSSQSSSPRGWSPNGPYSNPANDFSSAYMPDADGSQKLEQMLASPESYLRQHKDYDSRRLQAARAMQEKLTPGTPREPNAIWAGFGFSKSSPAPDSMFKAEQPAVNAQKSIWGPVPPPVPTFTLSESGQDTYSMMNSNLLDATSAASLDCIANNKATDLTALLSSLNLDKYIGKFKTHEIDIEMFSSLTEPDLKEIGVHALGARRKMLLAISEYKKRKAPFKVSLAPGAERGSLHGVSRTSSFLDRNCE